MDRVSPRTLSAGRLLLVFSSSSRSSRSSSRSRSLSSRHHCFSCSRRSRLALLSSRCHSRRSENLSSSSSRRNFSHCLCSRLTLPSSRGRVALSFFSLPLPLLAPRLPLFLCGILLFAFSSFLFVFLLFFFFFILFFFFLFSFFSCFFLFSFFYWSDRGLRALRVGKRLRPPTDALFRQHFCSRRSPPVDFFCDSLKMRCRQPSIVKTPPLSFTLIRRQSASNHIAGSDAFSIYEQGFLHFNFALTANMDHGIQ